MDIFQHEQFAQAIRQHRTRRTSPISLREAADECGISASTLSRIERGSAPDMDSLVVLCIWLGRTPKDFFGPFVPVPEPVAAVAYQGPERYSFNGRFA